MHNQGAASLSAVKQILLILARVVSHVAVVSLQQQLSVCVQQLYYSQILVDHSHYNLQTGGGYMEIINNGWDAYNTCNSNEKWHDHNIKYGCIKKRSRAAVPWRSCSLPQHQTGTGSLESRLQRRQKHNSKIHDLWKQCVQVCFWTLIIVCKQLWSLSFLANIYDTHSSFL